MTGGKQKTVALIQARMGSSRLPGKVLADICGRPALWHIIDRLKRVREIDDIAVATSINLENNVLEEYCRSERVSCFRGSENDVLDRCYRAASEYKAGVMVRITGDCPLTDPQTVSMVINTFREADKPFDYVHNAAGAGVHIQSVNKFPTGTSVEVIPFASLERAWKDSSDPLDRGEGFPCYFWRRPQTFACKTIPCSVDCASMRWTLDHPEDLEFIRKVYARLYVPGRCFSMEDVLCLLKTEPELSKINGMWIGKEGNEKYFKNTGEGLCR
jgi:spore coat polysaccharide biosynthesis protein SpsF